jgi:hypothetical protein
MTLGRQNQGLRWEEVGGRNSTERAFTPYWSFFWGDGPRVGLLEHHEALALPWVNRLLVSETAHDCMMGLQALPEPEDVQPRSFSGGGASCLRRVHWDIGSESGAGSDYSGTAGMSLEPPR